MNITRIAQPRRLRLIITAVIVAIAGLVIPLSQIASAVYAPPNPLQGLRYDSAFVRDFLHSIPGPVVLVGHSYGGAVITNAATGDPQVKALVYVDAFAPAQGQTLEGLLASHPGSCAVPANLTVVPIPGPPAALATPTSSRARTPAAWPTTCPSG